LKDRFQSIRDSINNLGINAADPKTWILWWLRYYHIICRHFAVVCY